jgi:hypothetical protein
VNLFKYRDVTVSNDVTLSEEMVSDSVEDSDVTNKKYSVRAASNLTTTRDEYLLNIPLDLYLVGLINDATNSSDCMTSKARMIYWRVY